MITRQENIRPIKAPPIAFKIQTAKTISPNQLERVITIGKEIHKVQRELEKLLSKSKAVTSYANTKSDSPIVTESINRLVTNRHDDHRCQL